jgi:F0F1-type ATP synthase alpha subunit
MPHKFCVSAAAFVAAGVKALDTLTPLGRGASLLVIGPNNSGKTTLALDAIQGCQLGSNMRCVLASTTLSAKDLEKRLKVSGQCEVLE